MVTSVFSAADIMNPNEDEAPGGALEEDKSADLIPQRGRWKSQGGQILLAENAGVVVSGVNNLLQVPENTGISVGVLEAQDKRSYRSLVLIQGALRMASALSTAGHVYCSVGLSS